MTCASIYQTYIPSSMTCTHVYSHIHVHPQIHHIQRLNNLWDSETIHSRTSLKVPLASSSPKLNSRRHPPRVVSSLHNHSQQRVGEGEEEEEVVRRKPTALRANGSATIPEPFEEKSIASLLLAADERIAEMERFNEKLACKM